MPSDSDDDGYCSAKRLRPLAAPPDSDDVEDEAAVAHKLDMPSDVVDTMLLSMPGDGSESGHDRERLPLPGLPSDDSESGRDRERASHITERRPHAIARPPPLIEDDVRSIFMWPRAVLGFLGEGGTTKQTLLNEELTMSTHFSGLGSAELAAEMLRSWAQTLWHRPLSIRHGYACEKSACLRAVLAKRLPGSCIFKDILDRFLDVPESVRKASAIDFTEVRDLVMTSRVAGHSTCAAHGGMCPVPRCDINVSGSPCRPWSRARRALRGLSRLSHPDVLLFLCWCRLLLVDLEAVAVHENVVGFDVTLLVSLVGEVYDVTTCLMKPQDVGFSFILRPRVYAICRRKSSIVCTSSAFEPYHRMLATTCRLPGLLPDCCLAGAEEVLREENDARRQRRMAPVVKRSCDWRYLLTSSQAAVLLSHERRNEEATVSKGEAKVFVVDLSVSASFGHCSPCIPTLRRSTTKRVWLSSQRRWLLPRELAAAMGFPVSRWLAHVAGVPEDEAVMAAPAGAIGNAMHIASAGCAIACALASRRRGDE